MTLPGGPADKLGNRYETWWTVSELVRMLRGETEEIRIEDPCADKAEFVVTVGPGSGRELHQAKRSHPSGKWSLYSLRQDGLLRAMGEQLADPKVRFVFASGSDAKDLAELCASARDAQSQEELERCFLKAQCRAAGFDFLCECWECDPLAAVDRLQRIDVRTIDERELEDKVMLGVQVLFLGRLAALVRDLRLIVADSVHRTWTRCALAQELETNGHSRRHVVSPQSALAAIEVATNRFRDGQRSRLINNTLIRRTATQSLLAGMGETATDSVLTGKAGSGKSGCVVELVDDLRERGLPVLAFRLDRVPLASNATTTDLGKYLALEESPVLVLKAAVEAAGRPGVLVIDQLDAASTMSGRSSGALELVEQLIQEARGSSSVIHTVVACRAFDWQHDHRLRRLVPPDSHARVDVAELSVGETEAVLSDAGFDPGHFRERELELLRLPQNLSLFVEADFDASSVPNFATEKALLDLYWEAKRKAVNGEPAAVPGMWMQVIEVLCNEMTARRQLSVPKEALDHISPTYRDRMTSEGVLTSDGNRYGFGHESFFDYCHARLFVRKSESLVSFLTRSEQHLFLRAQVRQILTYLRDSDRARYEQEIAGLLSDDKIRDHLKELAFALLSEVPDPQEDEWTIWESWLDPIVTAARTGEPESNPLSAHSSPLSTLAWRKFVRSESWFEFAERRGTIEHWLGSGRTGLIDLAMYWLHANHQAFPDQVAILLEPYAESSGDWRQRMKGFMQWAQVHRSRRLFDLFLRLVENGTLDEACGPIGSGATFWDILHGAVKDRPDWMPEVLALRLKRLSSDVKATGAGASRTDLIGHDRTMNELVERSAGSFPARYVECVLPEVLAISDATLNEAEPPRRDRVWGCLIRSEHPDGGQAVLEGLVGALGALARDETVGLQDKIADLRHRETHTANLLLLGIYAASPERFAEEAVSMFCEEPWRFECGYSESPQWCAMECLRAAFPCCTLESRAKAEETILGYYTSFERSRNGSRSRGYAQFSLLSAIPVEFRSPGANRRLAELKRKFGEPQGKPVVVEASLIGSPIERDGTDRMTDDQWLRAVATHRSDSPSFSRGELRGGAFQLAQALRSHVSEEPERFARLSLRFPADTNPNYLVNVLAALKGAPIEIDLKLQVCSKALDEAPEPCGQALADLLGSIKERLPDAAVEMLNWLATEHDDPSREHWRDDAPAGGKHFGGDIHGHGINTTRGRAVLAIGEVIRRDATCIERFRPTLVRMVRDPSPAVLSCVAGSLRVLAWYEREHAFELFQDMDLSEEGLLATPSVRAFIKEALQDQFSELRPVLERMLRSHEPRVCEAGARLVCIAFLSDQDAGDLVDEAFHGTTCQRLGVAQVAAANINLPGCGRWSEESLNVLFNDEDSKVRNAAASCFRQLEDEDLGEHGELIGAFCDSRAFHEDSYGVIRLMEASLGRLPGMTCVVCEKFLDRFSAEARDIRTARAGNAFFLAKLVFRTYQQHPNDEWTPRALDLIDRLCLEGIGDSGQQLEQFDR